MNETLARLPWNDLLHAEGDIPWPALHAIVDATATCPDAIPELLSVYDRARETARHKTCYADLYVPAIFALAGPRLDDGQRRQIAAHLIQRLLEAAHDEDEFAVSNVATALGALGPAVLPAVLDALNYEVDTENASMFLWDLTVLAEKTDDESLRHRVIETCGDALERAARDAIAPADATAAAWTLAALKRTEYADLMERLRDQAYDPFDAGEYNDALCLLQNRLDYTPARPLWEQPVEENLERQWGIARDWFAQRDVPAVAGDDVDQKWEQMLATRFVISPIAATLPEDLLLDSMIIIPRLLRFSGELLDVEPADWDEPTLRELLLELFPRKLIGGRQLFAQIAPATEAFLTWLAADGILEQGRALAAEVRTWSEQIVTAGMDPKNWSPGKRFDMRRAEAGHNAAHGDAFRAFLFNGSATLFDEAEAEEPEPEHSAPTIPIVEHTPKTGRNDPCPCGSGRKYKKCCGSPTKQRESQT